MRIRCVCVSLSAHHAESHGNCGALQTPMGTMVIVGAQISEGPEPLKEGTYQLHYTNGWGVGERGGQQDVIPKLA